MKKVHMNMGLEKSPFWATALFFNLKFQHDIIFSLLPLHTQEQCWTVDARGEEGAWPKATQHSQISFW
jgi:hypothetical protein